MSRIGKMPVTVPTGVEVAINSAQISVKGSLGSLVVNQNTLVKVENNSGSISFVPVDESREANAMSGTMRQLVNNMVQGVSKGLQGRGARREIELERGLLPPSGHPNARRYQGRNAYAHRSDHQRCRPPTRWPNRFRDSRRSSPRALQGYGHPLCG